MAMFGTVNKGSALLATWDNPYTAIVVDYTLELQRRLAMALALERTARSVCLQPLGRGGYVDVAKAYRPIAKQRGYLKTLAEKLCENPNVARFFGAADLKLFVLTRSVADTPWNHTGKERLDINSSFEESADLAEHFAKDLSDVHVFSPFRSARLVYTCNN